MQCPVCGKRKIWKYGVRVSRRGQRRRFLCRSCGHIWEVLQAEIKQEQADISEGATFPVELKNYFLELMKQIIDDIERGLPPEKAGWCIFNSKVVKRLIRTGLCESGEEGIRLILSSRPLPRELAWTDEGDIISDIKRAVVLGELLSKLTEDPELRIGAEYAGLLRMLQTSDFPILASLLFEEGLNPKTWFVKAPAAAADLAFALAKKLWGLERLKKALLALSSLDDVAIPERERQDRESSDKIKKILRWDMVSEVFGPEILEALGFVWYADFLMERKKIKYLESIRIVQKKAWDILEVLTGRRIQELEEELLEATREMERRTTKAWGEDKSQITNWHEVVRFPW
jgi:hypothetical protein